MNVLYRITLVPLEEELQAADPGLIMPFNAYDAAFDVLARRSAQLIKLLIKRGSNQGYLPDPAKSLFILDTPIQEEAAIQEFTIKGLTLNFVSGNRYLVAYLGQQKDLDAWVKPQVEAWAHMVIVLVKIAQRHLKSDYAGLGMSL